LSVQADHPYSVTGAMRTATTTTTTTTTAGGGGG
jgi:hypothetical protein